MRSFDDYASFIQHIESDMKIADFNPVRFVNVETMETWVKVKSYFTNRTKGTIKLSDFCETDDIAPNLNRLKVRLRQITDTTLLIPISEYLRINRPLAHKTLTDILHLSYPNNSNGKLRLYVLLYRMKDIMATVQIGPREINTVTVIQESLESDYSLAVVQRSLDFTTKGNEIDGFKKYLIYWEQNPDKPIVLRTKNAVHYQDIVFSDNVEVIVTAFELLRYLGLSRFVKEYGTEEQWGYLVAEYCKSKNIDIAIGSVLQTMKYDDALFGNWISYDPNKRWLLLLWSTLHTENEYLKLVFSDSSIHDFENRVYSSIVPLLSNEKFWQLYAERKRILTYMGLPVSEATLAYCKEENGVNKLKCLTDCSPKEREMIISTTFEMGAWNDTLSVIENVYPLLATYVMPLETGDLSIDSYFDKYRKCKLANAASDDFLADVDKFAEEQGKSIWQLRSRNAIVEQTYSPGDAVLFVDALGAEYAPALKSCFDENSYDVDISYGYCNMPSTTSYNNDFYKGKARLEPIFDLDDWKHSKCDFPQSIEKELTLLAKIKKSVDGGLTTYKRIIIAADHGTSRLAVIAKGNSHDASENAEKYKYGRYCIDDSRQYDLFGCISHDSYWIFANYDRFSQKGFPICEIHGGASLEEMIVPVITVSRKSSKTEAVSGKISVTLLTPTIKLPIDRNVKVMFRLEGSGQSVQVSVDNQYISCECQEGVYFFVQNIGGNKSLYTARVLVDGRIAGDIQYRIIRPMEEKRGFDI